MLTFNLNIIPKIKGAYLVGGSIRDILSGRLPNDYDFAVPGPPGDFARKIAKKTHGHVIKLGKPGLTLYRVSSPLGLFDVSPIIGDSIEKDLYARDITVNAMAVELHSGKLIDPFNGLEDLKAGKIRMVSEKAFIDDPIRLLRAYRIAANFGFEITENTCNAIRKHRKRINNSAGERIHAELVKILETPNSLSYLQQMINSGLLFEIIPELTALKGCGQNQHHNFDVFDHTISAYRHLESILSDRNRYIPDDNPAHTIDKNKGMLKFALLLHDIGKPQTRTEKEGRVHFYRHEKTGADMAKSICNRLKFASDEKNYIFHIISNHLRPLFLYSSEKTHPLSKKAKTAFFLSCKDETPDIILHAMADSRGKASGPTKTIENFHLFAKSLLESYFKEFVPADQLKPLITGKDLIQEFSISPSPRFKTILDQVRKARLEGAISSKAEAIDMVRSILHPKI